MKRWPLRRCPLFLCSFLLEGLNLERFLHLCRKDGVPLLQAQRRSPRGMRITCYTCDFPALSRLADEKGWTISEHTPRYASACPVWMRRHMALCVSAAVMLLALCISLQFIWLVDIRDARMYAADIASFLREEGVRPGAYRRAVNLSELENELYARYPDIAWFSVYRSGVKLVVDCKLGVAPIPVPNAPCDVVADQDGWVQSVLVRRGTAAVRVGDWITQGQVLIRGTERAFDDAVREVPADGDVVARVRRSETALLSTHRVISGETGRQTVQTQIGTPWLAIPAEVSTPNYLQFDREIQRFPVVSCFFPVWYQTVTDREVWLELEERPMTEVMREAGTAAERLLAQSVNGDEIIDKWLDYCMIEGGKLAAIATAELALDIGRSVERRQTD